MGTWLDRFQMTYLEFSGRGETKEIFPTYIGAPKESCFPGLCRGVGPRSKIGGGCSNPTWGCETMVVKAWGGRRGDDLCTGSPFLEQIFHNQTCFGWGTKSLVVEGVSSIEHPIQLRRR